MLFPYARTCLLLFTLCLFTSARSSLAQCPGRWVYGPDQGVPGASPVYCSTLWDPDGDGPEPELLVVGGEFTAAGRTHARAVAAWDGRDWRDFGLAFIRANALCVYQGQLLAGHSSPPYVSRWTGSGWEALGGGVTQGFHVYTMAVIDGQLVIGGQFSRVGNVFANNIARWDGTAWSSFGPGLPGEVRSITQLDGEIIAGGRFDSTLGRVARWTGAAWASVGPALGGLRVHTVHVHGGVLHAGGSFSLPGSTLNCSVARFDGTTWHAVGATMNGDIFALATFDGELIAAGGFSASGAAPLASIARLSESGWAGLGSGIPSGEVRTLLTYKDRLAVGGQFSVAGGEPATGIALWDGNVWSPTTGGRVTNATVAALAPIGATLVIAGASAERIALWNGADWTNIGNGRFANNFIAAATEFQGAMVVAGTFSSIDGVAAANIARRTGATWEPLGEGTDGHIAALAVYDDQLIAAGSFTTAGGNPAPRIARWTGSQWIPFPAGPDGPVRALAVHQGDLYAAGEFPHAGGVLVRRVARWDGAEWHAVGAGFDHASVPAIVNALQSIGSDLYAGGYFTRSGLTPLAHVARWDGTSWQPVGAGFNNAVYALGNYRGMLCAGGDFSASGGSPVSYVARWDGQAWLPFGAGVNGRVLALAEYGGELVVGGSFVRAAGEISNHWARWSDTGAPWIAVHPAPQDLPSGGAAVLTVTPASGYDTDGQHTFEWMRNGVPVADGPGGASAGGGTVTGASTAVLTITNVQPSDAGVYTVVFTNPCGSATSHPATLTVACPADWNHDTLINSADISAYLASWLGSLNNNNLDADFDNSGSVNSADISAFLAAWLSALTQGC